MRRFQTTRCDRRRFLKMTGGTLAGLGAIPLAGWSPFGRPARGGVPARASRAGVAGRNTAATNDFIQAYAPGQQSGIPLTQKMKVLFVESSEPHDHIDPSTVHLRINGGDERMYPYYIDARGNREFHFVPFPFWEPATVYAVTILAGVEYAGSGERMEEDATWSFETDIEPPDEDYHPLTTVPLAQEEIDLAHAGSSDRFLDENVVKDFMNTASTLYQFSISADPYDPEIEALGEKMVNSLANLGAIGLAAPQLGINRRLFVAQVSGRKIVFINPRVTSYSSDLVYYGSKEGCLSIDYVMARVGRPKWITVEYDTPGGGRATDVYLEDDDAKVWLHEYDHINGILMTDRQQEKLMYLASPAREESPLVPFTPREF